MRKIQIIIKVTNGCNLRCKYCYNAAKGFKHEVVSIDRLEKLFNVFGVYDAIDVIYHGGEPMLAGRDFYKQVLELQKCITMKHGVHFHNSIQTNATLLDEQWLSFFKKHSFAVGMSFDGLYNDQYRGKTEATLKAIELLNRSKTSFGCIAVVADKDYDIRANYEYLKQFGMSVDFSYVFPEGNAKELGTLSIDSYVSQMIDLFDYWVADKNGIQIRNFRFMINKIYGCGKEYCHNGSCIGNFFCLDVDGSIYGCSRESVHKYCFGNIDEIDDVSQIFNSKDFKEYVLGAIARRNGCKEKCELFDYCKGGCSDDAITHGDISKPNPGYCYWFKTLYNHIKASLDEISEKKVDLATLNPNFKQAIIDATALSEVDTI